MAVPPITQNIGRLLSPRSIAFVGGASAERAVQQTRKLGFAGEVHAVNPSRTHLAGIPCVPRIEDLPKAPDAVFLGIPRDATADAVGQLAELGAGGAVCFASGFAEIGDGAAFERELAAAAGDLAVIGPNCHGFVNALDGVALWPDEHGLGRVERGVALITQSGNIGITLTMQDRGLDIAYVLSVGNQAVLTIDDYMNALAADPRVTAIGLYVEGLDDPQGFARAALDCARRRIPIVALKAGRSSAGARATLSHTASLAGADDVIDAFFRRYGVIRVDSLAALIETLKLVSVCGPIDGMRIGSMSCSGGDAAMVADIAEPLGLTLDPLPADARVTLEDVLGDRVAVANPLDYHTYIWGDRVRMTGCFAGMLGAGYDATLLVLDYPRAGEPDLEGWDLAIESLIDAQSKTGGRAIVVSSLPETLPAHARRRLAQSGIAPMQGLPECLGAIADASWLGRVWRQIDSATPPLPAGSPAAAYNGRPLDLSEPDAKRLFAGYGIHVPEGREVVIAEAGAAARELGFPVVVKTAAEIAHKTDVGGVVLGLADEAAVVAAAKTMSTLGPRVRVEEMLPPPLAELIVGINVEPGIGPYLVVGAGGTMAELLRDRKVVLLPAGADEIEAALRSLRIWPILEGYRGAAGADIDSIVAAALGLARLALEHVDRVLEVDLNPLMVYPAPRGAVAADALIRLSAPI